MSESKSAPSFPYDHLAVLGFEKLRAYVPPKPVRGPSTSPQSSETTRQSTPAPQPTSPKQSSSA